MNTSINCFYLQPFKWEENVERSSDNRSQVIHCWAKAIPATPEGTPLSTETVETYLFRVKNYPYRVTLILPPETTEREVSNIKGYFQEWFTTYQGMVTIDRDEYVLLKNEGKDHNEIRERFSTKYYDEYSPRKITQEKRRTVYYYKRVDETPLEDGLNRFPEVENWVINIDFANRDVAMKFSNSGPGGYMSAEYINRKKGTPFEKQIYGKTYKFSVGFRGIDSVQKLLTEKGVSRCGWFFVRDAVPVKAAEKVCFNSGEKTWVTETGQKLTIDGSTKEFYIESVSIFQPVPSIVKTLKSVPSIISWDIECYSDNHKAMPNPWTPSHAAYIITAVYQQYKKPNTRIRRAFVFGNCDYTTPTEADGVTSSLVKCDSEIDMIRAFSSFVQDMNADILIGYNIFGFDINYLNVRMERNLYPWDNMGRLRENNTHIGFTDWSSSAYGKNQLYWFETPGRICVDMMKIVERDYKFSDYKLETVSQALLGKGKNDVTPQEMFKIYEMCLKNEPGCESQMFKVVMYGIQDAVLPIELFEKINGWPFFIESSNVMCVNPMDLFTRGQQLRLLNQFYDKCYHMGFVIDSRKVNVIEAEGAYVVEPKRGLHHNMMTLDFASLYPSIMIAHNIGHDTLVLDEKIPDEHCHVFEWSDDDKNKINKTGGFEKDDERGFEIADNQEPELDASGQQVYKIQKNSDGKWRFRFIKEEYGHRSVAATMLVDLLGARKSVRNEQKVVKNSDPVYWDILEQRQKAIKVSCNSVYGMLLAQNTGKLPLAEGGVCVTYRGRELNLEMQRLSKDRYGAVTVYGDSVTGETPVLVQDRRFGPRYVQIKSLGQEWMEDYHGDKEISTKFFTGLQVWSDGGWTDVRNIIRHKCKKRIMRVITSTGLVDVTEDHSLLNPDGEKVSPKDVKIGDKLLHVDLPVMKETFSQKFESTKFSRQVDAADFYLKNDLSFLNYRIFFREGCYVIEECNRENLHMDMIVNIIDMGVRDEYVYDFTTENHHFSAGIGRMVVHNTDSIMVKTAYTKLMVEVAHKFDHKPTVDEVNQLAEQMGIADYSTEIAARFLDHYHGFKEEYEVCNEMGEHIAHDISSHLPKPISLEFENVFVDALFLMKKRYACVVLDRDKMVVKRHPEKIYTKGIMLARRDNCKWARELFREALYNILCGKNRQEIAYIVQEHIHRLLTWQVPMKDLEIIQKLGFDYKSETYPLKLFSEHLQDIGKPAKPNDRIAFIVSTKPNRLVENPKDAKLGHYYRLSETLREEISAGENSIDYLYYIERLMNDVDQIFSIGYMDDINKKNASRLNKERELLEKRITIIETKLNKTKDTIDSLERSIEKSSSEKDKELTAKKRDLRSNKKMYTDLEKEIQKIRKNQTLMETKGIESFDKKMNRSDLLLDDRFFEHIVYHLSLRRQLFKEIATYTPKPKLEPKLEKKPIKQQTLSNWLK